MGHLAKLLSEWMIYINKAWELTKQNITNIDLVKWNVQLLSRIDLRDMCIDPVNNFTDSSENRVVS